MATEILYPKVSLETNSGTISRWHVKDGDEVTQGQLLFEVDNDKTVVEVDAPHDGTITILKPSTDHEIDVGQSVASLFAKGEAVTTGAPVAVAVAPRSAITASTSPTTPGTDRNDRTIATPLAKRMASDAGIDLALVSGSGPSGRIQKKDIVAAIETAGMFSQRKPFSAQPQLGNNTLLNTVWLRKGEATPLVLLHGFASDHNNWRGLFAGSQWQQPLLAVDLPSHGESPLTDTENLDAIAAMVEDTLKALDIQRAILVGHSFGAAVSTRLASRGNLDIRALGLFSPAGLGPEINVGFVQNFVRAKSKESVTPWLHELVHDKATISETFINAVVQQRQNQSLSDAMTSFSEHFFADGTQTVSIVDDLASLEIPVRVIYGKQDKILPFRYTRNLPDNVALHAFEACGHMPHLEKRSLSLRILEELSSSTRV
ncbi:acetoin dehydrogenase dihydrolipoyllysine-residue acetyltransferase subunit [Ochrobactrum sp. CM-21-5]|nr:acetoin dehydrogenase dihydrolipoyllysine-residue acetyltransferase subunit [Ochrobactrum sp. CM-21-5]MBC2887091.1 acetoin dehydrogenase dihydrolipoyllysine-residue acetyltransferase subunit [Ochrobactrum sp. CM-21-5]